MSEIESSRSPSRIVWWVGLALSVLPSLLLLMGAAMNLARADMAVKGAVDMGYPEGMVRPLGAALLVSTTLYLVPRTAVIGAILLTGYLGGAVATHVRAGDPLGMVLFPAVFGGVLWLGLVLRYPRVRAALFAPAAG